MKTITRDEFKTLNQKWDHQLELKPVVELGKFTYIQIGHVRLTDKPQSITILDATDVKDNLLKDDAGMAVVALGDEGPFAFILLANGQHTQCTYADLLIKIGGIGHDPDFISDWIERQFN